LRHFNSAAIINGWYLTINGKEKWQEKGQGKTKDNQLK
jgi:hypothetical protein